MKTTKSALDYFLKSIAYSEVKNERDLGFQDPFVTVEQKNRDTQITELLTEYVKSYKGKVKHSAICRYIILIPCILVICAFAGMLIYFSIRILGSNPQAQAGASGVTVPDMVSFITACISFITLIIGLLTIITKYFFPENDEQYITTIVEAIQKNDLENKRENAKYKQHDPPDSGAVG